jgi:hypothetical protein
MRTIPQPGTYPAKTNAAMVVYEAKTGSLCVAIPTAAEGWSGKGTLVLGNADGVLNTKNIQTLREIFGWDGVDPFALQEIAIGEHAFDIVGEHESYVPEATDEDPNPEEVMTFKIKWFNPPGRSGMKLPTVLDDASRKKTLTKWGSKFKSNAGKPAPAAAAKPAAKTEAKAEPKSTTPARPAGGVPARKTVAGQARTSTQDEVYVALKKARPDVEEDVIAAEFYQAQDDLREGANGEFTPVEWGKIADALGI